MPLQRFSFLNPSDEELQAKNWRQFDAGSKTIVRNDLVFVTATGTPVIDYGYFTLYGPIVFYTLKVTLNNNDGWTTSSYIQMPYAPLQLTNFQAPHSGHVFVSLSGAAITTAVFADVANPTRLAFAGAYTNTTGADQGVSIQGWYFRN